jgi:two-component system LytT family response regulator
MKLRVVLADDERAARKRLLRLLQNDPELAVVAEAANGHDALAAIRTHRPDGAFLSIEMPGLNGFEVMAELPRDRRPAFVLVTGHAGHAVQAFDANAIDYLLKPVPLARLTEALERVRIWQSFRSPKTTGEQASLKRLLVRGSDRIIVVAVEDIDWIGSADNYVLLHVGSATHVLREKLCDLAIRLETGPFLRISRSALIHLHRVREII